MHKKTTPDLVRKGAEHLKNIDIQEGMAYTSDSNALSVKQIRGRLDRGIQALQRTLAELEELRHLL